jgi:hypothetical protein
MVCLGLLAKYLKDNNFIKEDLTATENGPE